MLQLPKLKMKPPSADPAEDIFELEEAKHRFTYSDEVMVVVEKRLVKSHEELIQLARRDEYKDKEFLEVELVPVIIGGG
ncbi:MAG: hypothetical protein E3J67_02590 [Dehalococcoidia bacterium]|nr:MAG: hypothetical protein E3J67_02590 [Dehalococcoidia bacterium]